MIPMETISLALATTIIKVGIMVEDTTAVVTMAVVGKEV